MALKIISFIFGISVAFVIAAPTPIKDVPFGVNEVINQVSTPNPQPLIPALPTGEFLIDTSTDSINQYNPAIAFDGTNYLIVWEDDRRDNLRDIYGARVDQNGNVLDPAGIPISIAPERQFNPEIAFDGTNYLVVWQDLRDSSGWDIYCARVNQQGIVLDSAGIKINDNGRWGQPSVASGDTYYLVVWHGILGARVNQQGIVIDTAEFIVSRVGGYDPQHPSIAFDGTNYLVVWNEYHSYLTGNPPHWVTTWDISGQLVSQQDTVLNGTSIAYGPPNKRSPSVAFDGTNYFVLWHDSRNGNADIYGTRVSLTGTVLDPNGIPISTAPNNQGVPSVAFDGDNYMVVWHDNRSGIDFDIYGAKVNQSGTVIEHFPVSTQSGDQSYPVLAHGIGSEFLITYQGWTDSINQQPINNYRIWGKFSSDIGIEEERTTLNAKRFMPEIYPNPARSFLAVRLPQSADRQKLKIFDVSGKLVIVSNEVTGVQEYKQKIRISLKGINPGIYFLRLGKETKKFLVVK
jgi:hypothetical protein